MYYDYTIFIIISYCILCIKYLRKVKRVSYGDLLFNVQLDFTEARKFKRKPRVMEESY